MKPRIIFGTLLLLATLAFLIFDLVLDRSLGVFILITGFVICAQTELFRMAAEKGIRSGRILGNLLALGILFFWWMSLRSRAAGAPLPMGMEVPLGVALVLILGSTLFRQPDEKGVLGVAFTAFALVYVAFLAGFTLELRFLRAPGPGGHALGAHIVIYCLLVSKATDIFAYLVGSQVGRLKLAPRLSPKKTWEGLLAGVAGSAVVAVLYARFTPLGTVVNWWQAVIFGILLGVAGQCGDLAESFIKRSFEKKDSSALIPEFGGLLDLIDGVLFTAPSTFLYLCAIGFRPV
jgi:phosphatidate cytidylyltransferase